MHQWYWCVPSNYYYYCSFTCNKGTSLPNAEALKLLSAQNGTLKCPCLQANHTQPLSFELRRLNSFLFYCSTQVYETTLSIAQEAITLRMKRHKEIKQRSEVVFVIKRP